MNYIDATMFFFIYAMITALFWVYEIIVPQWELKPFGLISPNFCYTNKICYIYIYILFLVVVVVGGGGGAGWWGEVGVGGGVANGIQTCSLISVPTLSLHQKEYFFEHYFSQKSESE